MGVYDYGNPRACGDNAFWKVQRQGGVKIWKPSWYGMDIFWNCSLEKELTLFLIFKVDSKVSLRVSFDAPSGTAFTIFLTRSDLKYGSHFLLSTFIDVIKKFVTIDFNRLN